MIRFGLPIPEVTRHFHPYLTQSEAVKLALLGFEKDVASLSRRLDNPKFVLKKYPLEGPDPALQKLIRTRLAKIR